MCLPSPDAAPTQRDKFFALLRAAATDKQMVKLVLAKPRGAEPGLDRVLVRPLVLRGEDCLSFTYRHATRDITKNLSVLEGMAQVHALLGPSFRNAHLHTRSEDAQLSIGKKGSGVLTLTKATRPVHSGSTEHNREKQRWLDLDRPFLVALGVTTAQHQLVPAMSRKWKQINKFIEVFAHALGASPLADAQALRVADFGSGKGYLTFAIHDWLQRAKSVQAQVTGVELRPDMVRLGNDTVAKLGLAGLRFKIGRAHV